MTDNLIHHVALLLIVKTADLGRQRDLLVVVVRAGDDVEVDAGAFAGEDLGGYALLGEVDLGAVDLVHQDGGDGAQDLEGEVLGLDDVDGGDEGVDDEGEAVGVFDGDGVGLALDDDGGVAAAGNEDGVRHGGFDLDGLGLFFEVFLGLRLVLGVYLVRARKHKLTIVHLLPSSSFFGGFLTRMLSGLGFFPGTGLFPRTDASRSGTVELARNEGFLCVISDLSTLRRPAVTDSPLLSSEKTALSPLPAAGGGALSSLILRTGGGPGGGGGGGAPAPDGGGGGGPEVAAGAALRIFKTSFAG